MPSALAIAVAPRPCALHLAYPDRVYRSRAPLASIDTAGLRFGDAYRPPLAMVYTKYPRACKALMAFLMEADQFNKWLDAAQGQLAHPLNAYAANPLWTKDPKLTVFGDVANRSLTVGGLGSVSDKSANALLDFILVDMFASVCLGLDDAKGAIKIAERHLQRIYR